MSSSSSDSDEDDTRFREACDPILSKAFNVSSDEQQMNRKQVEKHSQNGEGIDNSENRHSFILLSKIQRSLEDHKNLPLSKGISLYQRKITSKEEKCHKEPTKPSYLARQLSSILDQNVEFSKKAEVLLTDESKTKNNMLVNDEHKKSSEDFSLLHGVSLSLTDVGQQISKEKKEKKKQGKFIEYCGSLDEEMFVNRCRNIAVTPDWILQKQGDYPWPHPKNIRYLDKYKAKKKHANGAVVLTPINDGSIDKNKSKMKVKSSLGSSVNKKTEKTVIKSQLDIQNKKRKQSRKRGGKKKKNNEQTSILSNTK